MSATSSARGEAAAWADVERLGYESFVSSPSMVIVVDDQMCVRTINPTTISATGISHHHAVGQHLSALLAPGTAERSLELIAEAARGNLPEIEVDFRAAESGHAAAPGRITVGMSIAPLLLDGVHRGLVLNGRDIEHRKRLEHELEELASSYRALAEFSELGIYRFSFPFGEGSSFQIDHVNEAFTTALGHSLPLRPGQLEQLIDQLSPPTRQRIHANRFGSEPPMWPVEFEWDRAGGETVILSIEEVPIRDQEGRVTAVLGIARDVTRARRREASIVQALAHEREAATGLRQVDQLRRLFLQAVSHELRTPLTTVLGFSSTLAAYSHELPSHQIQQLAERIVVQGQRIQRLLDDLLDVERLSRGVVVLDREDHDLADVVRAVLADDEVASVAAAELQPAVLALDRGKIERVIVNLVANARRHAGRDASITVKVEAQPDGARLVVEDDGPGVPDDLKTRIFEPFAQGPASQELPSPGTGIGLTLVAEFVRLHGGRAFVEDAVGGGARFVVFLPAVAV